MKQLNKRQLNIFEFIRKSGEASSQEIKKHTEKYFGDISRITIIRDINKLLKNGLIEKRGKGRNVQYKEKIEKKLLSYFDVREYFKKESDKREIAFRNFNFEIFDNLKEIFTETELKGLKRLNDNYKKRVQKLSPGILKKEFERLTIELSWKSSRIEGNTYSLIDTEILIKELKEAKGHKKEEAIMILNHKKALDYILQKRSDFKKLTIRKIENIHRLIVENLGVSTGFRKKPVGIVGTGYKPLDNEHQVREAIEKTVKIINNLKDPFSKAVIIILMISYVQPFEDGNKRTSRLLSNALLLANNICPLSFRSIDESDYKKAMVLFYEQNSARFFKQLFVEQFKFAIDNYF